MTNSSSALIKAMLIASASSMITYKTMKLWKNNKDVFLGSLLSLIMNHMGEGESDPLDLFQGPLFGQKGFGQMEIEETRIIMAVDPSGTSFWSRFDEGEWDILQAIIKESDSSPEEVIADVMEARLQEGKVSFGNPFGVDEDD